MSIHVIAQGIVSIRSFSFRKEAEIKKLFFKKLAYKLVGCYTLALGQNEAYCNFKRWFPLEAEPHGVRIIIRSAELIMKYKK